MSAPPPPICDSSFLITGGAGFIGSHLADALVARGARVTIVDNFTTGKRSFVEALATNPHARIVQADVFDKPALERAMKGADAVFHVAADPEVRTSWSYSRLHLEQNVLATHQVLETMREAGVKRILFTSTSTVYGEAKVVPTPEEYGPLVPISIYGASKLASEALLSSFAYTFDFQGLSFRFANVVGPRSNHGVTYDFVHKLRANPKKLEILGDGRQRKSYVHVADTVDAMIFAYERMTERYDVYNIGSGDAIDVREIADVVTREMRLPDVQYHFTGGVDGGRGWKGDVKLMQLSIDRLKKLGWAPRMGSAEAVRRTAEALLAEESHAG